MARTGGRQPRIGTADIVRVGRALGLNALSVKAVAAELGVTAAALYRHVEGRALQLRAFTLAHPGLARYLQLLFPRGDAGRRLLTAEVEALGRRGYSVEAAIVVSGAVASLAIALTASEELSITTERDDADGLDRERAAATAGLQVDDHLSAHATLPQVQRPEYVRLVLTGAVRGLLGAAPPGRPVADIITDLATTERDL